MAKKGMKRPSVTHTEPRNDAAAVPEISGKAKTGNDRANPIIAGTHAPAQKVYHVNPHGDKPISRAYGENTALDTDLARDNAENDTTAADLQDL